MVAVYNYLLYQFYSMVVMVAVYNYLLYQFYSMVVMVAIIWVFLYQCYSMVLMVAINQLLIVSVLLNGDNGSDYKTIFASVLMVLII